MTQPSTEFLDLQAALAGEYSLQRELGRGGMGVVYFARDVQLDRDVAIKVLPAHLARDAAARERFLREARMAAGLSHPHIVPIHRVSEAGGFVTALMDAARRIGDDLNRLAEAQREVEDAAGHSPGSGTIPTPT
jgi:serine/threonine-protein kinase